MVAFANDARTPGEMVPLIAELEKNKLQAHLEIV